MKQRKYKTPSRDYIMILFILLMFAGYAIPSDNQEPGVGGSLLLIGVLGMIVVALNKIANGDFRKKEDVQEDSQ